MSYRSLLEQQQVITNGDMSQSTVTSLITILGQKSVGSYQFNWSGTSPSGTIQILVSNDYKISSNGTTVVNAGNWIPMYFIVDGGAAPVNTITVSGNSGDAYVSWADKPYAIKAVYTKVSGTGTLNSFLNAGVI